MIWKRFFWFAGCSSEIFVFLEVEWVICLCFCTGVVTYCLGFLSFFPIKVLLLKYYNAQSSLLIITGSRLMLESPQNLEQLLMESLAINVSKSNFFGWSCLIDIEFQIIAQAFVHIDYFAIRLHSFAIFQQCFDAESVLEKSEKDFIVYIRNPMAHKCEFIL